MEKRAVQKSINHTAGIIYNIKQLVIVFGNDLKIEFLSLWNILLKNLTQPILEKRIAAIIVVIILFIPSVLQYCTWINTAIDYVVSRYKQDEIIQEIQKTHANSIKNFFDTYNKKYGIDCDRIREVNVDINMSDVYWTEKKYGKWCLQKEKIKIYPVSFDALEITNKQQVRTGGKWIYIVTDNEYNLKKLCYVKYNVWKEKNWELWYRKINPFENQDCYVK